MALGKHFVQALPFACALQCQTGKDKKTHIGQKTGSHFVKTHGLCENRPVKEALLQLDYINCRFTQCKFSALIVQIIKVCRVICLFQNCLKSIIFYPFPCF